MKRRFWQSKQRSTNRWLQVVEGAGVGGLALLAAYLFTATIFGDNRPFGLTVGRWTVLLLPYGDVLPLLAIALTVAGVLLVRWGDGFTATYPFGLAVALLEFPAILAHNQLAWGVFVHWPRLFEARLATVATVAAVFASAMLWLALHSVVGLRRLDEQLAAQQAPAADRAAVRQGWRALTFGLLGATLALTLAALLLGVGLSHAEALYAAWPWLVLLAGLAGTAALAVALQLWTQPPPEGAD